MRLRLPEYVPAAIAAAVGEGIPVRAVRFDSAAEARGPSVRYRETGQGGGGGMIDSARASFGASYEIECRARRIEAARFMAESILDRFGQDNRVTAIEDAYDAPDNASSQASGYVAHVLSVALSA